MRTRLRHDLTAAIKARDVVTVAALRSALSVIDNAEAVDVAGPGSAPESAPGSAAPVTSEHVAGSAVGLGAAEVDRRVLTPADEEALVRSTVEEWTAAADRYDELGRGDAAARVRAETEVLQRLLGPDV